MTRNISILRSGHMPRRFEAKTSLVSRCLVLIHPMNQESGRETVARPPSSCKRLRMDVGKKGIAGQRLCALELVDEMGGGFRVHGEPRFLLETMFGAMPFPVASIQVDGGSEYGADFDSANSSTRIEFWSLYDGPVTVADVAAQAGPARVRPHYGRRTGAGCGRHNEYLVENEDAA